MAAPLPIFLTAGSQPNTLQTYQALVLIGLQDEFLQSGKPNSVNQNSGFLNRILQLIPKWRDRAGYLILLPSEPLGAAAVHNEELPRTSRDVDKLIGTIRNKQPVAWTGTPPELFEPVKKLLDEKVDHVMGAPYGTINTSTALMSTMRAQVITKIFICGCITDTSIYSLMLDSAKKGWDVVIIEDCLGFLDKDKKKHKITLKQTREKLFVETITSKEVFADLDAPTEPATSSKDLTDMFDTLLGAGKKRKEPELPVIKQSRDRSRQKEAIPSEKNPEEPENTASTKPKISEAIKLESSKDVGDAGDAKQAESPRPADTASADFKSSPKPNSPTPPSAPDAPTDS